jgi:predicted nucleic acid-binding protein
MIMVDTNVLIDLREEDSHWFGWSVDAVARARVDHPVSISAVVVGELAMGGNPLADTELLVSQFGIGIAPLDARAAHNAGQAHRAYRAAGGGREKLLADFLIGGHAMACEATLMTRDPRRYRAYFPSLLLITPETNEHD